MNLKCECLMLHAMYNERCAINGADVPLSVRSFIHSFIQYRIDSISHFHKRALTSVCQARVDKTRLCFAHVFSGVENKRQGRALTSLPMLYVGHNEICS